VQLRRHLGVDVRALAPKVWQFVRRCSISVCTMVRATPPRFLQQHLTVPEPPADGTLKTRIAQLLYGCRRQQVCRLRPGVSPHL